MLIRSLLVVMLVVSLGLAQEKPEDTSTKVFGKLVFAKDLATFEGQTVELLLFEYDPRIADKAATQIDKLDLPNFKHTNGTETVKAFSLGEKGKLQPGMNYYLTAFVVAGKNRTHIGKGDHVQEPFNKVLTNGQPREVTIRFRAVK